MPNYLDQRILEVNEHISKILNLQLSIIKTEVIIDKKLRKIEIIMNKISTLNKRVGEQDEKINSISKFVNRIRNVDDRVTKISKVDKTIIRNPLNKKILQVVNEKDRYVYKEENLKITEGFCMHCNILIIGEYSYMAAVEVKDHCQDCYDKYHK